LCAAASSHSVSMASAWFFPSAFSITSSASRRRSIAVAVATPALSRRIGSDSRRGEKTRPVAFSLAAVAVRRRRRGATAPRRFARSARRADPTARTSSPRTPERASRTAARRRRASRSRTPRTPRSGRPARRAGSTPARPSRRRRRRRRRRSRRRAPPPRAREQSLHLLEPPRVPLRGHSARQQHERARGVHGVDGDALSGTGR